MTFGRWAIAVIATGFALNASAQVGEALKESGKAIGQSAQEGGDKLKAAMSSQPNKAVNNAKAEVHKTKAHYHRHKAKKAADSIGH